MAEFYVQKQPWQHWPKTLVMVKNDDNGEIYRYYVPKPDCGPYTYDGCRHSWDDPATTLKCTYDMRSQLWSACCTCCRQWTGFTLTCIECKGRAEKGWWCE